MAEFYLIKQDMGFELSEWKKIYVIKKKDPLVIISLHRLIINKVDNYFVPMSC